MVMPGISAGATQTARLPDPFPTFKFRVEVGSIVEALFMECSGLEMHTEVQEYQEGGLNDFTHKFPGATKLTNVTLKRGFALSNEIFLWYKEMENCLRGGQAFEYRNVTITLYSSVDNTNLVRWTLTNAFPVRWVGPTLRTDEAAFAVESLEFSHHGIQFQGK